MEAKRNNNTYIIINKNDFDENYFNTVNKISYKTAKTLIDNVIKNTLEIEMSYSMLLFKRKNNITNVKKYLKYIFSQQDFLTNIIENDITLREHDDIKLLENFLINPFCIKIN